jgi:hypothetical protein
MRITMLDGHKRVWHPLTNVTDKKPSVLHIRAVEVIKKLLPISPILNEVAIPIDRRRTLFLDIFLPIHKIAIEVQGAQHGCRVAFFQTKQQHNRQVENDRKKREWTALNNITLLEFWYNEEKQWEAILKEALGLTQVLKIATELNSRN